MCTRQQCCEHQHILHGTSVDTCRTATSLSGGPFCFCAQADYHCHRRGKYPLLSRRRHSFGSMSVAERAAYVITSGSISLDASMCPVAALATVGSASGGGDSVHIGDPRPFASRCFIATIAFVFT